MRGKRIRAAWAAVLATVSLVASACGAARPMPNPATGASAPLKVLVFYDDRAEAPTHTLLSLIAANRSAIWELAPLWYAVQPNGSVRDTSEADVKDFARSNHILLMPLVVNAGGTSSFLLGAGSCTSGACAQAVSNLVAIVRNQGYDGLNIDFELLKTGARSGLTAFVNQLHQRLRAMHKVLTVDVIPAGSRRQAAGAYDFPALARDSDDIVLMTYDAHDDTSAPGPIAPLAWVTKRVNVALQQGVAPSHLILGLADYGYDWTTSGHHGVTIGLKQVDALIAGKGIHVMRTADGSPHFTYGGGAHVVWYEDQVSIVPKIELARKDHLKALALWMAGYETAAYWNALRAAAAGQPASGAARGASASSGAVGSGSGSASGPPTSSGTGGSSSRAPSSSSASGSSGSGAGTGSAAGSSSAS